MINHKYITCQFLYQILPNNFIFKLKEKLIKCFIVISYLLKGIKLLMINLNSFINNIFDG